MIIAAIDPGNMQSAICFIDTDTLRPVSFCKKENTEVMRQVKKEPYDILAIERIASYGMPVGKDVFQTCEWIGRFTEAARKPVEYVYRKEEKLHLCGDPKAKDVNIRRALIERFAQHDLKNGKGTKKKPDWFYGFHADCWAAYAVGLTYIETRMKKGGT